MAINKSVDMLKACIAVLALGAIASSCFGDKTEDDYLNDQANKHLQDIQKIAGSYGCYATSPQDQSVLGYVTVNLGGEMKPVTSSDGTGTSNQAYVSGDVNYSGITKYDAPFDGGDYDASSGVVNAQISVSVPSQATTSSTVAAATTVTMNLNVTVSGDSLSGSLEVDGRDGFGALLNNCQKGATSDAAGLSEDLLKSGRAQELTSEKNDFVGNCVVDNQPATVTLSLIENESSTQQTFFDVFSPQRSLVATYQIDLGSTQLPAYSFSANIDDQAGALIGTANITDGAGAAAHTATLNCNEAKSGDAVSSWACYFTADGDAQPVCTLKRGAAAAASTGPTGNGK